MAAAAGAATGAAGASMTSMIGAMTAMAEMQVTLSLTQGALDVAKTGASDVEHSAQKT